MVGGKTMTVRKLNMAKTRSRLPDWFRTRLPSGELQKKFNETKSTVTDNMLHTVCQEARCPNIHECWAAKDATFMVAGQECTRSCKFCAVGTVRAPPPLDVNEPANVAHAVSAMDLNHAVITVVNRDDLPDSGASHYRKCLEAIRQKVPSVTLELLCSDLAGDHKDLADLLLNLDIQVFAHNVECVPRLDLKVRDRRASFEQSLGILVEAKKLRPDILTKSSIMVGLGETDDEITDALQRLREAKVDLVTIGQYLAPSPKHLPVDRFPEPISYDRWSEQIERMGFLGWACGPLVRSSYRAGELLTRARAKLKLKAE